MSLLLELAVFYAKNSATFQKYEIVRRCICSFVLKFRVYRVYRVFFVRCLYWSDSDHILSLFSSGPLLKSDFFVNSVLIKNVSYGLCHLLLCPRFLPLLG